MYKEIDPKWFTKAGIIKSTAPKEIKLQNFLNKALLVHGDTYDYSAVDYTVAAAKIDIICKVHGVFSQRADSHLRGRGCPSCAGNAKSNTLDFITKANLVHHKTYTYDKVDYVASNIHVLIGCSIHGYFSQEANSHLKGRGCPECAISTSAKKRMLISADEFLTKALLVHGDKYDYSKTIYSGYNSMLTIICPIHGEFSQTARSHLYQKQGCPSCSNRDVNSSKGLYVVYSPSLSVYKVGITNNIKSRIYSLNNYNKGESFELVKFFDFKNSHHAKLLERYFHFLFKEVQAHDLLSTSIHGKTELFYLDEEDLQYIDSYIKEYCKNNNLILG